jgi:hypothetical protein
VPNATTGLNTIISSMALGPGDVLFSLNIGYGSVKKMLARAAADSGAAHVEMEVTFPLRWVGERGWRGGRDGLQLRVVEGAWCVPGVDQYRLVARDCVGMVGHGLCHVRWW